MFASQIEQRLGHETSVGIGVEYLPITNLAIRSGIVSNPTVACFGVGYSMGGLRIDIAFSYHQRLGYSPHLSISYTYLRNKADTLPSNQL